MSKQHWVKSACLFLLMGTLWTCGQTPSSPSPNAPATLGQQRRAMTTNFTLMTVANAAARQALCNDGSPAKYYIRRATAQSEERKWVVHLRGGRACTSIADCETRWNTKQHLMTSTLLSPTLNVGGIFSQNTSVNPDFHDWNHVYVHYCSSDHWIGDGTQAVTSGTFAGQTLQFRGFKIVRAVFQDLANPSITPGEHIKKSDLVLFTGSSAGAIGMRHHLDFMRDTFLPQAIVRGVNDSEFYPSPISVFFGLPAQGSQSNFNFWSARPDASCVAANPAAPWACLATENLQPHLTTPQFVFMDQEDQLTISSLLTNPFLILFPPAQRINMFATATRNFLSTRTGVYSPRNAGGSSASAINEGQGWHTAILKNNRFTGTPVGGVSYRQVLGSWFLGHTGPTEAIE